MSAQMTDLYPRSHPHIGPDTFSFPPRPYKSFSGTRMAPVGAGTTVNWPTVQYALVTLHAWSAGSSPGK